MKRAVITGGSRGIGRATALLFAERGYAVTALCTKACEPFHPAVNLILCDVADEGRVKEVFESLPAPDVLVCNAGVSSFGQVQDVSEETLSRVLDVNLKGAIFCCKHAVKKMLSRGGAIVTVGSVWGETGASCESVYAASKGGLIAFTKSLAKELAPAGITANCVSPGVIDTEMNARFSAEERRAIEEEIPLGRYGTGEEVASAVLFLAEHRYITGQVLGVNGGFHIP